MQHSAGDVLSNDALIVHRFFGASSPWEFPYDIQYSGYTVPAVSRSV